MVISAPHPLVLAGLLHALSVAIQVDLPSFNEAHHFCCWSEVFDAFRCLLDLSDGGGSPFEGVSLLAETVSITHFEWIGVLMHPCSVLQRWREDYHLFGPALLVLGEWLLLEHRRRCQLPLVGKLLPFRAGLVPILDCSWVQVLGGPLRWIHLVRIGALDTFGSHQGALLRRDHARSLGS